MAKRIFVDLCDEKSGVTGTSQLFDVFFPELVEGAEGNTKNIAFITDCGTFQGNDNDDFLNSKFNYDVSRPEFAILTHGHLDHYGRFPLAIKEGFQGPIFTTYVTKTFLTQVFLEDCLKIEKRNAKKKDVEPNFTESHTSKMESFMVGCPYKKAIQYNDNICLYFFDNGHVPGAAITLVQLTYPDYEDINIVISGDYNDHNTFFKVNPLPEWVYELPNLTIIIEATYGDTKVKDLRPACFIKNIIKSVAKGKTCIVPAFSFVRMQEVYYALKEAQDIGKLDARIPIYNDGKTATGCTKLFLDNSFKTYPHMREFLPQNLTFVEDKDFRRFLKHDSSPKIIVSSSGMGSYGPSQSYIDSYVSRSDAIIHATGHVSPTSKLGKLLTSEEVACTVFDTDEFSAHAKQDVLIEKLVKPFMDVHAKKNNVKSIIITHGDKPQKSELKNVISDNYDVPVHILSNDTTFRITSDGVVDCIPRNLKQ